MFALAIVGVSGCAWDLQTTRRVAEITNWGAATGVAVRRRPRNPLLKPMIVGGIPLGILVGLLFYFTTRRLAVFFHAARQKKLLAKANEMRKRASSLAGKEDMAHRA